MTMPTTMRILFVIVILILAAVVGAAESGNKAPASNTATTAAAATQTAARTSAAIRVEGEKRFRTNCGRCHMPPHKFPPRMMATIVRHMRVRALITDEDMRYILAYMTE
jgi:mono/diheme cytochrome c family protein